MTAKTQKQGNRFFLVHELQLYENVSKMSILTNHYLREILFIKEIRDQEKYQCRNPMHGHCDSELFEELSTIEGVATCESSEGTVPPHPNLNAEASESPRDVIEIHPEEMDVIHEHSSQRPRTQQQSTVAGLEEQLLEFFQTMSALI
jgi:hypothetical protein